MAALLATLPGASFTETNVFRNSASSVARVHNWGVLEKALPPDTSLSAEEKARLVAGGETRRWQACYSRVSLTQSQTWTLWLHC